MPFNGRADLRPTRGVDPDTAILYCEPCGGWIFNKFWHARRARFPFFAACISNQFGETRCDERRRVRFAVPLHRCVQELLHAAQNLYCAIFGIAAQTNHCGDVEIEFPKRLRQTVRGPVLFLARNPGTGTEITDQIWLSQNDSSGTIDFRCRWIAT